MDRNKITWPGDARNAVLITVNLDAEYAARAYSPEVDVSHGTPFEVMGRDGMETGLPRLMDVLGRHNIKATFFVPGKVAESYPEALLRIVEQGHEIGCRGYENENLALLTPAKQREVILRGRQAIEAICGIRPMGFRAPAGELTLESLQIVSDLGFIYSSSLSDDDLPYFIDLKNGEHLLEIPVHAALYDLPYFIFHFDPPIPAGQARIAFGDDVLTNWKWEYDGYHQYRACYVLQLDPQIIGTQGRVYLLEKLLDYVHEKKNAWMTTGAEVSRMLRITDSF
jgi:peptidoglycan/xylan/chitin deacetylase (PgdA/CDA1 family)